MPAIGSRSWTVTKTGSPIHGRTMDTSGRRKSDLDTALMRDYVGASVITTGEDPASKLPRYCVGPCAEEAGDYRHEAVWRKAG